MSRTDAVCHARRATACPCGGPASSCAEVLDGVWLLLVGRAPHSRVTLPQGPRPLDMVAVSHCRRGICLARHGEVNEVICPGESFALRLAGQERVDLETDFEGAIVLVNPDRLAGASRSSLEEFDVDLEGLGSVLRGGGSGFRRLQGVPRVAHVLVELMDSSAGERGGCRRLKVIELLRELSVVGRANAGSEEPRSVGRANHERVAYRAQAIMTGNLETPVTIPALARACETSPTVLKQAFREVIGVPVYTWYRSYRIHEAARLLEDRERSIADVAAEVGYSNPSKFTKAFAACMGKTPSQWRASL